METIVNNSNWRFSKLFQIEFFVRLSLKFLLGFMIVSESTQIHKLSIWYAAYPLKSVNTIRTMFLHKSAIEPPNDKDTTHAHQNFHPNIRLFDQQLRRLERGFLQTIIYKIMSPKLCESLARYLSRWFFATPSTGDLISNSNIFSLSTNRSEKYSWLMNHEHTCNTSPNSGYRKSNVKSFRIGHKSKDMSLDWETGGALEVLTNGCKIWVLHNDVKIIFNFKITSIDKVEFWPLRMQCSLLSFPTVHFISPVSKRRKS